VASFALWCRFCVKVVVSNLKMPAFRLLVLLNIYLWCLQSMVDKGMFLVVVGCTGANRSYGANRPWGTSGTWRSSRVERRQRWWWNGWAEGTERRSGKYSTVLQYHSSQIMLLSSAVVIGFCTFSHLEQSASWTNLQLCFLGTTIFQTSSEDLLLQPVLQPIACDHPCLRFNTYCFNCICWHMAR